MKIKSIKYLVIVLSLLLGSDTFAARFFLSPGEKSLPLRCESVLNIMIDSESKEINAADAILLYNPNEWIVSDQDLTRDGVQIREGSIFDFYAGNTVDTKAGKIFLTGFNLNPYKTKAEADIFGSIILKPLVEGRNLSIKFDYTPNETKDSNIADVFSNDILNTAGNGVYKVFSPTSSCSGDTTPPEIDNISPSPDSSHNPLHSNIRFNISDESGVDIKSVVVEVDSVAYKKGDKEFSFEGSDTNYTIIINPTKDFLLDIPVTVNIKAIDKLGNFMPLYSFRFNTPTEDALPPYVDNPVPGAGKNGVPLDSNIVLHLMDDGSGVDLNSIQIKVLEKTYQNGDPRFTYSGNQNDYFISIDPLENFPADKVITVEIEARDLKGNQITPYKYSFNYPDEDNNPPYVTSTIPEKDAKHVSLDSTLSFDIRDHIAGVDLESVQVLINEDIYTHGNAGFQFTGDKFKFSITITPQSLFPQDEEINVEIHAKDLRGNAMPSYVFSFNKPSVCGDFKVEDDEQCEPPNSLTCSADCTFKDISPPYIHPVYPLPGAKNIPLDTNISFHIKDDLLGVDIETLEVSIDKTLYNADSEALVYSGDPLDYLILISPEKTFKNKQKVAVEIKATDLKGNRLDGFQYIFNDPGEDSLPPYVTNISPAPGSNNAALDTKIYFEIQDNLFGVDIDSLHVQVNDQQFTPQEDLLSFSGNEMKYLVTLSVEKLFLSKQEVFVEITAQDLLGNTMSPYRFSFNRPDEDNVPPWILSPFPDPQSRNIPLDSPVSFAIKDNYIGVDISTLEVQINKKYYTKASPAVQFSGDPMQYMITITPDKFPSDTEIEVIVHVKDLSGNEMNPYKYYFNKPFICGDGIVEAQEECEPPGVGSCDKQCHILKTKPEEEPKEPEKEVDQQEPQKQDPEEEVLRPSAPAEPICGNGMIEVGEACEPPHVGSCSGSCQVVELPKQELMPLPDSDGDGISDLEEIMDYGTDPAVAEPLKTAAKITNWKNGDVTVSQHLIIKGVGSSENPVKAFSRSKDANRVQLLGEDLPDATHKFVIDSLVELESGTYFLKVESYDKEGKVSDSSEEVEIHIDTTKDSSTPTIKAIDVQQIDSLSAGSVEIYNSQPIITGIAPPFSKVTLIFESEITSVTVTADKNGFYSAAVPKSLEPGAHKVTVYSVSQEGIRSEAVTIDININPHQKKEEKVLSDTQEKLDINFEQALFNWWKVIAIISIIINLILFIYKKNKLSKKDK